MKSNIFAALFAVTLSLTHAAPTGNLQLSIPVMLNLGTETVSPLEIVDSGEMQDKNDSYPEYVGYAYRIKSDIRTTNGHSNHSHAVEFFRANTPGSYEDRFPIQSSFKKDLEGQAYDDQSRHGHKGGIEARDGHGGTGGYGHFYQGHVGHISGIINQGSFKSGVNNQGSFNQGHRGDIFMIHGRYGHGGYGHSGHDDEYQKSGYGHAENEHSSHGLVGNILGNNNQARFEVGGYYQSSFQRDNRGHGPHGRNRQRQGLPDLIYGNSGYIHGGKNHTRNGHAGHISGICNRSSYARGVYNQSSFNQGHSGNISIIYRRYSHGGYGNIGSDEYEDSGYGLGENDFFSHGHVGNNPRIYNNGREVRNENFFNQGHGGQVSHIHGRYGHERYGHGLDTAHGNGGFGHGVFEYFSHGDAGHVSITNK